MTDRRPTDTTNLDIYGHDTLPWDRPRCRPREPRPGREPHVVPRHRRIGWATTRRRRRRRLARRRRLLRQRARDPKVEAPRGEPGVFDLGAAAGPRPRLRRDRDPGHRHARRWSGSQPAIARAAGKRRSTATRSPPRTAPRARDHRPGTSTASRSTRSSASQAKSHTAPRAGASPEAASQFDPALSRTGRPPIQPALRRRHRASLGRPRRASACVARSAHQEPRLRRSPHRAIDLRVVGHQLAQGGGREREDAAGFRRHHRRRPAVAEVAAPIDRRDLAEGVAGRQAVHLEVVDPSPTARRRARCRRSGRAPSVPSPLALAVALLAPAARKRAAWSSVIVANRPTRRRSSAPNAVRSSTVDASTAARTRGPLRGRAAARRSSEIGHDCVGDAVDARSATSAAVERVVQDAQPDRVPAADDRSTSAGPRPRPRVAATIASLRRSVSIRRFAGWPARRNVRIPSEAGVTSSSRGRRPRSGPGPRASGPSPGRSRRGRRPGRTSGSPARP